MVLKSLGKKLKSIGKKKDKKSEEPKSWKRAEPKTESKTGPTLGKSREPKPEDKKPKWVKPEAPKGERTPLTLGGKRGTTESKPGHQWKPGEGPTSKRGPLVLGGKRGTKEPTVESPGSEGPTTEVPKTGGPGTSPYTTQSGPGTSPYTTQSGPGTSPYTTQSGPGTSPYTTQSGPGTSPYVTNNKNAYANKYLTKSEDGDSPYTMPLPGYTRPGGTMYSTQVFIPEQSYSDISSSEEDLPGVDEEYVDEAGHVHFKSRGTSAYQHSDPNMVKDPPKQEGPKSEGAKEEESKHLSDSESDSGGAGLGGDVAIGGYTSGGAGANKYLMNEGVGGGYTNNGYNTLHQPGGEQTPEDSLRGEEPHNGYDPLGNAQVVAGSEELSESDPVVSDDDVEVPGTGGEQVAQVGSKYTNKYMTQGGAYTNKYTTQGGGYTSKYTIDNSLNRYTTQGGGTRYSTYREDSGTEREMLSISSSSSQQISSSEESVKSFRDQPLHQNMQPDVQPEAPLHEDEKVALMQKNLRLNTRSNKDMKEVTHGASRDVTRLGLSKNEKNSRGWGLLPMRDGYRNRRGVDGTITKGEDRDLLRNGGPGTQYFISRGMQLEYEARKVLASNLKQGRGTKREDTVLSFREGKWLTADGNVADTTNVKALDYSINEFREKLTTQVKSGQLQGLDKKLQKVQEQIKGLSSAETMHATMAKAGMSGRWIFVMNGAGQFFAGQSVTSVVHHSSFLAGGAVAAAGEIAISGGTMTAISNVSGHYRPGPVYLWQAVKQLELLGVPLGSLRVDVMGVNKPFKNAAEFLGAMDPSTDSELFDAKTAVDHLNRYFAERTRNKNLEKEALEKGEKEKDGKVEGLK